MATLEDINQRLKEANEGMTPAASMLESRELEKIGLLKSISIAVQKLSSSISPTVEMATPEVAPSPTTETATPEVAPIPTTEKPNVEVPENDFSKIVDSIDKMNKDLGKLLKKLIAQEKKVIQQQDFKDKKEKRSASLLSSLNPAKLAGKAKGMLPSMPKLPSVGGLFSGIAGAVGGVGLGTGALLGGAGLAGIGASELLKTMQDLDATKIRKNVEELLMIGDTVSDNFLLTDSLALGTALGAIGAGLAAFSIGAGVTAAIDYFTQDSLWAENIVENLNTLFSIGNQKGAVQLLGESFNLAAALGSIGLGLAAFSAGTGVAAAIDYFTGDSNWAENIVKNVETLLQLGGTGFINSAKTLAKGLVIGPALGAIGLGIAAFSAGSGFQTALSYFDGGDWAQNLVDNVNTLLTLGDDKKLGMVSVLAEGVVFAGAMGAIGAGLVAFSVGSGVSEAINTFKKKGWAERVVENVKTLLSINKLFEDEKDTSALKEGGKFFLTMTAIATGLTAFSLGQSAIGLAQWINDPNWTKQIVDNVDTLLSIADLEGMSIGNVLKVEGVLGGLGLALAAFGIGGTVAGISEAVNKFASDEDFADRIKRQTQTLLEIPEMMGDDPVAKSLQLKTVLANVGGALSAFSPSLKDTLKSVGEGIAGFFGAESPFDKIMGISENSEQLEKSASSLERINEAISKLGGTPEEQTDEFVSSINKISTAVKNFGGEEGFWSKLGASITGFFSKDPLKPFLKLADKGDELFHAGIGLEKITDSLERTGNFGNSNDRKEGFNNIIQFAKDLAKEQNSLDKAAASFSKIAKSVESISKNPISIATVPESYVSIAGPSGSIESLQQESVVGSSNMQLAQQSLNENKTINEYNARGGDANINTVSSNMVNNYTSVYSAAIPSAVDTTDRTSGPMIYR